MKTSIPPVLIASALVCFALAQNTQAVSPPPGGGYAGGNTAEGQAALLSLTTGTYNTAIGIYSLLSLTDGEFCTGVGAGTLLANTANDNTAVGAGALLNNATAGSNTAMGAFALLNNTTGIANTALGTVALASNTTGSSNVALGVSAGQNLTSGSGNVCIGRDVFGAAGESNTTRIRNIYTTVQPQVGIDPDYVTINSSGRLGRANVSSRRYKHDIKPMHKASEAIYALKPVSFRYHTQFDATQTLAFGLIAEDVAEIAPNLVGRNEKGEPESVRYEQINAMLLNEFLKEHRKNEQQEVTIARQQKQIEALTAGLQKVSAQLEANKQTPPMVANNH
jgi:hypothetical protein